MGKWEETEEAYHGRENPEEKVIPERDKIGETNGDRIRRMTDEELADFLVSEDANACTHCEFYDVEIMRCCLDTGPCVKELAEVSLLDYLSKPVQEFPAKET